MTSVDTKQCPTCGDEKPVPQFYADQSKKDGLSHECKECKKARSLKVKQCPEWSRNNHLVKTYGLTAGDIDEIEKFQGSMCAICGTDEPAGKNNQWHVDHCHDTGEVRGLLCSPCNMALGLFKDSADTMREAIRYLSEFDK